MIEPQRRPWSSARAGERLERGRSRLDRRQVGGGVADRHQPVAVLVAPHLSAQPSRLEVRDAYAVVDEDVGDRVLRDQAMDGVEVGRAEHAQPWTGSENHRRSPPCGPSLRAPAATGCDA